MEGQNWGLENVAVKKVSVNGFNWLPEEHLKQLEKLLNHLNLGRYLDEQIKEQEAVQLNLDTSSVNVQEIKFDDRTKIEIASGEGVPFFAKLFHIDETANEDGTYNLHIVAIENDVLVVDSVNPVDYNSLGLSEIVNALVPNEEDVSAKAWYSDVPCVGNGCCVFTEYNMVTYPVFYNWCGANCGSGTPINAADTCCRTHDYCYNNFSSYPTRCSCDLNLINCLGQTSSPGATIMATAFRIKRKDQGC